jgi:hypothetical protein
VPPSTSLGGYCIDTRPRPALGATRGKGCATECSKHEHDRQHQRVRDQRQKSLNRLGASNRRRPVVSIGGGLPPWCSPARGLAAAYAGAALLPGEARWIRLSSKLRPRPRPLIQRRLSSKLQHRQLPGEARWTGSAI